VNPLAVNGVGRLGIWALPIIAWKFSCPPVFVRQYFVGCADNSFRQNPSWSVGVAIQSLDCWRPLGATRILSSLFTGFLKSPRHDGSLVDSNG
jgi:hypothetical protein